jgi:hypothetical protein
MSPPHHRTGLNRALVAADEEWDEIVESNIERRTIEKLNTEKNIKHWRANEYLNRSESASALKTCLRSSVERGQMTIAEEKRMRKEALNVYNTKEIGPLSYFTSSQVSIYHSPFDPSFPHESLLKHEVPIEITNKIRFSKRLLSPEV